MVRRAGRVILAMAVGCAAARAAAPETAPANSPEANKPRAAALRADPRPQQWYGVAVENLPPTIARQLKLKPDQGLMVVAVLPKSPAEKAGLQADDILIELDGEVLTSQEDLARAANTAPPAKSTYDVKTATVSKGNKLTFLRAGDKKNVVLTAAPRPEAMLVSGANLTNFTQQSRGANSATPGNSNNDQPIETRNIVLPNGTAAQVGTGYSLTLNGNEANVTVQSLRQLTSDGATVVLSQETDPAGVVHSRIVVGSKSYPVEPGKLDTLPVELRPLAEQLLQNANGGAPPTTNPAAAADATAALTRRVEDLEKINQDLRNSNARMQEQLQQVIDLLKQQQTPAR